MRDRQLLMRRTAAAASTSSSNADMPADPLRDTAPDAARRSWFLIAWPCNSAKQEHPSVSLEHSRSRAPSIVVHSQDWKYWILTFHVDALLLAKGGAQFLNLRSEATLHILRRKFMMVGPTQLGRREGVLWHRPYPLDQGLALTEVLTTGGSD